MGSFTGPIDVESILAKLTLEEKVSLLAAVDWWRTPVIHREGVFVPHLKTTDGPNGARGESYVSGIKAACFPSAVSLGASFDEELLYQVGREVAKEAETKSASILLAPTLNVIRSPLGGRNYETYSEDPFVLGTLAAAYVRGCQSRGIAATPKHFVANEAENERKTLSVEVDEQTLREIYLLPFQLVMKLSDPWCFMTSYNRVNGTYVADDHRLVTKVLRQEWGFEGVIVSDWMGTYSTAECINAGVDLEMPGPTKWRGDKLVRAVRDGAVSQTTLDASVRRVLGLAKHLGRFENPDEPPEQAIDNPERDEFITDAAAEGMVLLKNEEILPIPQTASVVLIGHHAHNASLGGGGSARVDSLHAVTPVEGFQQLGFKVNSSPGVPVFGALPHPDPVIVYETGKDSQSRYPVKVEWFNGDVIGQNLAYEEMRPNAEYMIKEKWPSYLSADYCTRMTFDITPGSTGAHLLSVITTGPASCYVNGVKVFDRPQETDLKPESFYFFKSKLERRFNYQMEAGERYTLVLEAWATDPDILNEKPLFGKMFQGAALRFHEHIDVPGLISAATTAAEKSDYAIVCVGTTNEIESEGFDRDTMDLTPEQYDLIHAVAKANLRTVVVNFTGATVGMTQFVDSVPAVLQAWFPGQECGHSVAKVLTGHVNPSGRLPFSWPKKIEDTPSFGNFPVNKDGLLHYNEKLDVGYRYYDQKDAPKPLFPFGYGLSYTTFEVANARTEGSNILRGPGETVRISCDVRNTGTLGGKVVVQFYVEMPKTNIGNPRPPKELKGYQKVEISPGQSRIVSILLDKYSVSIYDAAENCWRAHEGKYIVHVATSVEEISCFTQISVAEDFKWSGV